MNISADCACAGRRNFCGKAICALRRFVINADTEIFPIFCAASSGVMAFRRCDTERGRGMKTTAFPDERRSFRQVFGRKSSKIAPSPRRNTLFSKSSLRTVQAIMGVRKIARCRTGAKKDTFALYAIKSGLEMTFVSKLDRQKESRKPWLFCTSFSHVVN